MLYGWMYALASGRNTRLPICPGVAGNTHNMKR